MTDQQERFLNLIQKFEKPNRIFSPDIERELEINDIQVRDLTRELRRLGYPIASGHGYWYEPDNPNILDHLELRAISEFETVRMFKQNRDKALNRQLQPLTLFGS